MLTEVHVMFCVVVATHVWPPFGTVIVTLGGGVIVNDASLISVTVGIETSVILIRPWEVGVFGITHDFDPVEAGVLAIISFHDDPLLVEYSILTLDTLEDAHVIF